MTGIGIALRGLGLLGKKGKTISSVKPKKSAASPIIKKLKSSQIKGYDPKNPAHKERVNKIRSDTAKDIHNVNKKYDRPKFAGGGRTNLLEELGRVEAEKSNRNRRAEISRVHSELNKGYKDGGKARKPQETYRPPQQKKSEQKYFSRQRKEFRKGGKVKKQGYYDKEDESIGMRLGKGKATKKNPKKAKAERDMSYGKWGKRSRDWKK